MAISAKAKNITHRKQKRESFTEFYFRITLSFYRRFRICITNTSVYAYTAILNSSIRTATHHFFYLLGNIYFKNPKLRMIAGSTALPAHIWKNAMICKTNTITIHTHAAMGIINVHINITAQIARRICTTESLIA